MAGAFVAVPVQLAHATAADHYKVSSLQPHDLHTGLINGDRSTKLMSCIFAILGLTFNLGYLWDVDKIYLDYDSQASSGIWRGLFPAALVMHLSFVTWGQFQYLIAFGPSSSHAAPIAFPRIFNAVFVLSNTVFTMFLLAAGLTEAVSASKLWHGYMDIRTTAQPILDPSAGFPPNFNPFTLEATLTEQFTSFQKWVRIYNRQVRPRE